MIKNIIFDVGKVLVSYEPDAYMERLGIAKEAQDAINKAMFRNKLWDIADQGIFTHEEMVEKFIAGAPKYETEIRQLCATIGNTIEMLPHAMEWLSELKARGYNLYILSNYAEETYRQTKEKLAFLKLVDGAVFSFECKMIKPQKQIYEHICQKFQLNCSESIFVDDRMENVEAARRNGILAVLFQNYEQAKTELDEMLLY